MFVVVDRGRSQLFPKKPSRVEPRRLIRTVRVNSAENELPFLRKQRRTSRRILDEKFLQVLTPVMPGGVIRLIGTDDRTKKRQFSLVERLEMHRGELFEEIRTIRPTMEVAFIEFYEDNSDSFIEWVFVYLSISCRVVILVRRDRVESSSSRVEESIVVETNRNKISDWI